MAYFEEGHASLCNIGREQSLVDTTSITIPKVDG